LPSEIARGPVSS